jgi:hypothetical protein
MHSRQRPLLALAGRLCSAGAIVVADSAEEFNLVSYLDGSSNL